MVSLIRENTKRQLTFSKHGKISIIFYFKYTGYIFNNIIKYLPNLTAFIN